ncbi:hypothetical protein EJB05_53148, partial [Eragrostis curvula]
MINGRDSRGAVRARPLPSRGEVAEEGAAVAELGLRSASPPPPPEKTRGLRSPDRAEIPLSPFAFASGE